MSAPFVRVVVAGIAGSAPREPGAAMEISADGTKGTIGGGALEWEAMAIARAMLAGGSASRVERRALGPALNQCCGGAVTLLFERFDALRPPHTAVAGVIARPMPGSPAEMPLAVSRILDRARREGALPRAGIVQGWMVEAEAPAPFPVWIWGAGHVGRALVSVLTPLPGMAITWIDTAAERFPADAAPNVARRVAADPATLVPEAPPEAHHLILTFSHALDLDLCHRLLGRGFATAGLIGSASKWARFRSRLSALGHADAQISRIACPIGDPSLGKHPQAIAVGVAAALVKAKSAITIRKERAV